MQAPSDSSSSVLTGITFMITSLFTLSVLDGTGKWLMAIGLPLLVLCWIRYSVHSLLVLAIILPKNGVKALHTAKPMTQILRGTIMLASTLCFFTTLRYLPQAEATAINFIAPLIVLAIAPYLLKEKTQLARWIAAIIGFMGILLIIRPSAGLNMTGVFFGLFNAVLFSIQFIVTRRLASENPMTTLVWSGLCGTLILCVYTLFNFDYVMQALGQLTPVQWLLLISTGISGGLGHLLQIQAYRYAPASMLAPFTYMQIISATALGWIVWRQFPDMLTWVGIAIICASGVGIALKELHQQGRMTKPRAK